MRPDRFLTTTATAFILAATPTAPAAAEMAPPSVYAPYQALIGEWDVVPAAGGEPVAIERFRWGPGNSYIWFATSILVDGVEEPHFEGMLMWNGIDRKLDMLIAIDLAGGLAQEQGSVSLLADGTISRDIVATYSEGAVLPTGLRVGSEGARVNFRQTFRSLSAEEMTTSLTREGDEGWQESFFGSTSLVMRRRNAAG